MKIKITMPSSKWERYYNMQHHSRGAGLALAFLLLAGQLSCLGAQTVIGGEMPDPSAILDLQSNSRGLLLPRLTTDQRDAIASPQTGLLIFNTTMGGLEINLGNPSAPVWVKLMHHGEVSAIDCGAAVITGSLVPGQQATGVIASIPYTGGNGGGYNYSAVSSTGVTGLTATLHNGSFALGADSLRLAITGKPSFGGGGVATFVLPISGQTCSLAVNVSIPTCRAKVSATEFATFMCYNLGVANANADPFQPSWEINGGYWQWGQSGQAAAGPSGSGIFAANADEVPGWNTSPAGSGAWQDAVKTADDPCPAGYRVPTISQWQGVVTNNTQVSVGTWGNMYSSDPTNYSSGCFFGQELFLPAAGSRQYSSGQLGGRGNAGLYWSSTEQSSPYFYSWPLFFDNSSVSTNYFNDRTSGYAVRCIAESAAPFSGSIGALDCGSASLTGSLTATQPVSGVSVSISYTGGNNGAYAGQSASSTGVDGLTVTLPAGTFANGAGSLSFEILGTPATAGTAVFALDIGGQACNLSLAVDVAPGAISALGCGSARLSGMLTAFQPASGVSVRVPYTGGNGGLHNGQVVSSTGVTGLTATLAAGSFANGADSLVYAISGTPSGGGTVTFALSIGGQSCTLSLTIPSTVSSLDCASAVTTGTLAATLPATGVSVAVPYSGGNSGPYSSQSVSSTGVAGLTATLAAGNLANGAGSLSYAISGTPLLAGTAGFAISMGGQSCSLSIAVEPFGAVEAISCAGARISGPLRAFQAPFGIIARVPYTGGNGGIHLGQAVGSTGVTGLTVTLAAGSFANGADSLSYAISGTAAGIGTATFALSIGGQSCSLSIAVVAPVCRAKVSSTDYKNFMCYNLASANTAVNPFQPSWEINGGYWQWGHKGPDPSVWLNTNTSSFAHGPVGGTWDEANGGTISGWSQSYAPNDGWNNAANDPCPTGYRLPLKTDWDGLLINNSQSTVGSWYQSNNNYSTGRFFGNELFLPAPGYRENSSGQLFLRGGSGHYWSRDTGVNSNGAPVHWYLYLNSGGASVNNQINTYGYSVRCVSE